MKCEDEVELGRRSSWEGGSCLRCDEREGGDLDAQGKAEIEERSDDTAEEEGILVDGVVRASPSSLTRTRLKSNETKLETVRRSKRAAGEGERDVLWAERVSLPPSGLVYSESDTRKEYQRKPGVYYEMYVSTHDSLSYCCCCLRRSRIGSLT